MKEIHSNKLYISYVCIKRMWLNEAAGSSYIGLTFWMANIFINTVYQQLLASIQRH